MYHGVDSHHPKLESQIIIAIENGVAEHRNKHDQALHTYALVDGVYDKTLGAHLWESSQKSNSGVVSLYGKSVVEGYQEVSPFLVQLSNINRPKLLQWSRDKPMLSFLQTPLSLAALQRHFAPFLQVHTPSDGMHFVIRLADTLCTLNVLEILDETQLATIRSGFIAWHLINRKGTLTTIKGTYESAYIAPAIGENNATNITDRQYKRLLNSSEADTILSCLAEKSPQLVNKRKASVLYTMISRLLKEMTQRNIKNESDRYALIMKAITYSNHYYAMELLDHAQKYGVAEALQQAA